MKFTESKLKYLNVVYSLVVARYALVKGLSLNEAAHKISDEQIICGMSSEGIDQDDARMFIASFMSEEFLTTIRESDYYRVAAVQELKMRKDVL